MEHSDIAEAISCWATRAPDAPAVLGTDPRSRGDLQAGADRLASLLHRSGVRSDDLVGVLLPRGAGLITAVLGVLRSGGGYLPFDVATPPRRLAELAEAVRLRWLVTDGRLRAVAEAIPGVTVLEFDGHAGPMPDSSQPEPAQSEPARTPARPRRGRIRRNSATPSSPPVPPASRSRSGCRAGRWPTMRPRSSGPTS